MAGTHQMRLQTRTPGAGLDCIRFFTNGTSDPDPSLTIDPGGIVGVIERAGQSQFRIELNERWVRVFCQANLSREAPAVAQLYDRVEGVSNATPGVKVRLLDSSLALNADTTGWEIEVWFVLTNRKGFRETS